MKRKLLLYWLSGLIILSMHIHLSYAKEVLDSSYKITFDEKYYTYTTEEIEPKVYVESEEGDILEEGTDFKVTYSNNKSAGKGKVRVTGIGDYKGSITKTFSIHALSLKDAYITLDHSSYDYDGKVKKPGVTVKSINTITTGNYIKVYLNNKYPGKASVKLYGKNNLKGTVTKYFTILPPKMTINSITGGDKITIKYKKITNVNNFEISYNGIKKEVYNSTGSISISGLTKGTYSVKIRGFFKSNNLKYYGKYSDLKEVIVK